MGFALFLLSAATLAFEINLTRLFSVAQFYHFAFMVVSLALLGFGASGTFLAIYPNLSHRDLPSTFGKLALGSSISMLAAYLLTNWIPFDSFSIAWDQRQLAILLLHYMALVTPFFFSGLAISLLLTANAQEAGKVYALNLLGSSIGCLCALVFPSLFGGEGMVSLSTALAGLASLFCIYSTAKPSVHFDLKTNATSSRKYVTGIAGSLILLSILVSTAIDLELRLSNRPGLRWMELRLSPYKSLSYALQFPGARAVYQRWNAFSRIDLVQSTGIRSLPGLSYRYLQPPPAEDGLLVDGDDLSPVVTSMENLDFTRYLPIYLASDLRSGAEVLILEPRGGLDILTVLAGGARSVTAVELNPLIIEAAAPIYHAPQVQMVVDSDRSYLRRTSARFDIIILSLTSSYHPIRSGAYSLAEDYRYTREAFLELLDHLKPDGLLVVTRWLQTPPSESLRAFALAVTALNESGGDPHQQIVALRGYNIATLLIKNSPYTEPELTHIRSFAASRAFDLDYLPGISIQEVNRYNVLPEPLDYQAYTALLNSTSPQAFYSEYPFDVSPPTDDKPFFSHSFKWTQASQVIAEMGRTWQPFGGAGYFVVVALLVLALIASGFLILLPLAAAHWRNTTASFESMIPIRVRATLLAYFSLIGIAFLFVEVPLIQRFILFLGNPAYAMTTVLFNLLLFSGLGSHWSSRISLRLALGTLVLLLLSYPTLLPIFFHQTLGFPLIVKLALSCLIIAPVGFGMGIPFPAGIRLIAGWSRSEALIPWAWGANGAASVVSSILAALIALSFGFSWVLYLGSACYAGAWLMGWVLPSQTLEAPRDR